MKKGGKNRAVDPNSGKKIRECGLDSQSARCLSELRASALLRLWYELAIHGAPQNNRAQAWERIDTDYQRLKKLI
ncbi:hypothetical protein HVX92_21850 (plasmid) [Escherichia fergusonii]|nr:hypothetical protein HVX92_21850 [Escherichia fergusonii]QMJ76633.1 hypothetical protein HVX91_21870 [Escherichia fergusonii]